MVTQNDLKRIRYHTVYLQFGKHLVPTEPDLAGYCQEHKVLITFSVRVQDAPQGLRVLDWEIVDLWVDSMRYADGEGLPGEGVGFVQRLINMTYSSACRSAITGKLAYLRTEELG